MEITSASAKLLYNAFQRGFQCNLAGQCLKPMNLFESFQNNTAPADASELVVSKVLIDESNGECLRSGSKLRLIGLDDNQKTQFKEGLLYLTKKSFEEQQMKKKKSANEVADGLKQFGRWLLDKDFTAIVDGPNIAYYMQNFDQGGFNYHQIKFVVDTLEGMGERVLVVLPQKYMQDSFTLYSLQRKTMQRLGKNEKKIRDDLLSKGQICAVPFGVLDDYYWMYASVSMTEDYIQPENTDGRWPGIRPMLVSNDKLRDHHMALLEPRLFRRWYSNYLVNFSFSAFVDGHCVDKEIGFRTADFYSREIQGNPSFSRDDSSNVLGTAWHFPVADWNENECLCIRIPAAID